MEILDTAIPDIGYRVRHDRMNPGTTDVGAGGLVADGRIGVFYGGNKKHAVALTNPIKTRIVSGRKQIKKKTRNQQS